MSALLPVLLGACAAIGLLLGVLGLRGATPESGASASALRDRVTARRARLDRHVRPVPAGVGAVAGAGVWWLTGWPVAGLVVAAAVVVIPPVVAQSGNRDLIALLEALAEWTRRLADLLASGAGGLEQAIDRSTRSAPAPIAEPVTTLAVRMRTRGLESALRWFAREIDHPAVHRLVASLILRAQAGGRGLTDILTHLADSLREEAGMRRQVEADRAKTRTSARALIGVITTVVVALVAATRDYLAPYASVAGQLWMTLVAVIFAAGLGWLAMLTKPPREPGWLFDLHRGRRRRADTMPEAGMRAP